MAVRPVDGATRGVGGFPQKAVDTVARGERSFGKPVEAHKSEFSGVLEKSKAVTPTMSPRVREHLRAFIDEKVRENTAIFREAGVLPKRFEADMKAQVTRMAHKAYKIG